MKVLDVKLHIQRIALDLHLIEDRWGTWQSNQKEDQNCPAT